MLDMSRAARDSRSMSTVRVRASAQEAMGGLKGMVCVFLFGVWMVMEVKEMSVMVGEEASREESLE